MTWQTSNILSPPGPLAYRLCQVQALPNLAALVVPHIHRVIIGSLQAKTITLSVSIMCTVQTMMISLQKPYPITTAILNRSTKLSPVRTGLGGGKLWTKRSPCSSEQAPGAMYHVLITTIPYPLN